jgi:hypothetical protein
MTTEATCQHYWLLEAGQVDAWGTCKHCRVSKLHRGSEYLDAERDREAVKRGSKKGGEAIRKRHIWKAGKPL